MKKKMMMLQELNMNGDGVGVDHYHHDSQPRLIPWGITASKGRNTMYHGE